MECNVVVLCRGKRAVLNGDFHGALSHQKPGDYQFSRKVEEENDMRPNASPKLSRKEIL
jgi:hypothetical protein